jgi:ferric iron reductase protein FhuF
MKSCAVTVLARIKGSDGSETRLSLANESSKPFEMSDYYKYSTKYRNPPSKKSRSKIIFSLWKTQYAYSIIKVFLCQYYFMFHQVLRS